jgi:4-amino-4-deoxy-L-arabinose transferase-like glycosyltransferase
MTPRLAGLAVVVGLAARLAFSLGYWHDKPLTHDEQEYLAYAINLAEGRGFTRDLPGAFEGPSVDEFARAPLYPAILAVIMRASGDVATALPSSVPAIVKVAQAFVGTGCVWLAYLFGARLSGPTTGVVAAWLMALWPSQVWMSAYALSEVLYAPLVLGAALAIGTLADWHRRAVDRGLHLSPMLVAGACAGLAALTRSAALAFVAVGCVVLWRRVSLRHAAALALATAIVIAPWTWRNWTVHHRFIPIAADAGVNLWIGNHPLATGEGDMATNTGVKLAQRAFVAAHPGLGPEALDRVFMRDALGWGADAPLRIGRLVLEKAFFAIVPVGPSYRAHSRAYVVASVVPYLAALPLAVTATLAWRQYQRPPAALLTLAVSAWLLMLVFFPHERYRLPVIDPVLIILASSWLARRTWPLPVVERAA